MSRLAVNRLSLYPELRRAFGTQITSLSVRQMWLQGWAFRDGCPIGRLSHCGAPRVYFPVTDTDLDALMGPARRAAAEGRRAA